VNAHAKTPCHSGIYYPTKAVSIARNLGHPLHKITTANFDLLPLTPDVHQMSAKDDPEYYYRPKKNIIIRPNALGGKGFHICGDHKETIPLIHALVSAQGDVAYETRPVERLDQVPPFQVGMDFSAERAILSRWMAAWPALASLRETLFAAFNMLRLCFQRVGSLLICGNGGSFADALHIPGELNKSFLLPRPLDETDTLNLSRISGGKTLADSLQQGLRTIVLGTNPSLLTAVDNDVDHSGMYFAQELNVLARDGDVLLAISTSGQSNNVIQAARVARTKGMRVMSLTGLEENTLQQFADVSIHAPNKATAQIQTYHQQIYHCLCEMLEAHFFGGKGEDEDTVR
jgi:D-sedoheptulose 7-phosphate isomerase